MAATGTLDTFAVHCDVCRKRISDAEIESGAMRVDPLDAEDEDGFRVVLARCAWCARRVVVTDGCDA